MTVNFDEMVFAAGMGDVSIGTAVRRLAEDGFRSVADHIILLLTVVS
jgi:hypothetical protein